MTTWNKTMARNLARKLHDINFYLSIARVNLLNGHEVKAAERVMAAMMAKDDATNYLPPIELLDDQVDFHELYVQFWTKDLLMYQAVNIASSTQGNGTLPNPITIPWEHVERELRRVAAELRTLLDRPWPIDDPCKAKLEAVVRSVESAADFLRNNPPDKIDLGRLRDGGKRLWEEEVAFLDCTYPDSPVPMRSMLGQFHAMNLWLVNIYDALRTGSPPWGVPGDRLGDLLRQIETVEGFKATMLGWLDEAFPGVNAPLDDWGTPGDPVPPAPGHASRVPQKRQRNT